MQRRWNRIIVAFDIKTNIFFKPIGIFTSHDHRHKIWHIFIAKCKKTSQIYRRLAHKFLLYLTKFGKFYFVFKHGV